MSYSIFDQQFFFLWDLVVICNITVCVIELVGCKVHDFVVNWKICATSSGHFYFK
jgi:hypothetical protein